MSTRRAQEEEYQLRFPNADREPFRFQRHCRLKARPSMFYDLDRYVLLPLRRHPRRPGPKQTSQGDWLTQDMRFRLLEEGGQWEVVRLLVGHEPNLLRRHGLQGQYFDTRREALAALEMVLEMEAERGRVD